MRLLFFLLTLFFINVAQSDGGTEYIIGSASGCGAKADYIAKQKALQKAGKAAQRVSVWRVEAHMCYGKGYTEAGAWFKSTLVSEHLSCLQGGCPAGYICECVEIPVPGEGGGCDCIPHVNPSEKRIGKAL